MKKYFTKEELLERHRHKINRILDECEGDKSKAVDALTLYVSSRIATVISCERRKARKGLHLWVEKGAKTNGNGKTSGEANTN